MVPNNDMIRMLTETEKVYQGEEDLLFPLITTDTKDRLYKSNNWKKMHHIPLKTSSTDSKGSCKSQLPFLCPASEERH